MISMGGLRDKGKVKHPVQSSSNSIVLIRSWSLVTGTIYRPPSSDHNTFLQDMQQLLSNPILQNKHCILMGDFNVDLLKCNEETFSQDFFDTLLAASYIPLITRPTRLSSHSSTLIDNIFSNIDKEVISGVILSDISDHCPIFARISSFLVITLVLPQLNW